MPLSSHPPIFMRIFQFRLEVFYFRDHIFNFQDLLSALYNSLSFLAPGCNISGYVPEDND